MKPRSHPRRRRNRTRRPIRQDGTWWLNTTPGHIGVSDQIDAATADADRFAHNLAASTPQLTATVVPALHVTGPVDDRVLEWIAADRRPECNHLGNPQPVAGILDRPGVGHCLPCLGDAALHTIRACPSCDDFADAYQLLLITHGPIVIIALVCPACHHQALHGTEPDA